jgi:hypothetical protein
MQPRATDRPAEALEWARRGDAFDLAVLEQRDPGAAVLSVEGDLTLRSVRGKVAVAAQEGIDLVTGAAARIMARAVDVEAMETLSVLGGAVKAELGKVKMYAATLDSFFERVTQRAKRSLRTVEELDQVRAQHIDYAAAGNAQLRGENALITAHDLAKINGEQVHIG